MNLRVIDMLGLNDAHIGHTSTADLGKGRAGHEKGDVSTFSPITRLRSHGQRCCAALSSR
jgi:hypothetical protein